MKIYTRTGDSGDTQIYVDKPIRVKKDDIILDCYGNLDELNSHIGVLHSKQDAPDKSYLARIQHALFNAGFVISASSTVEQQSIDELEQKIDAMTSELPAQTRFILPGGCETAAQAHVCRAVCRRAERSLISLSQTHDVSQTLLAYINRLSDYLFTYARYCNHINGLTDTTL